MVYFVLGEQIAKIFSGVSAAGTNKFHWDGKNDNGIPAANGVYFYIVTTAEGTAIKKMIRVKNR